MSTTIAIKSKCKEINLNKSIFWSLDTQGVFQVTSSWINIMNLEFVILVGITNIYIFKIVIHL